MINFNILILYNGKKKEVLEQKSVILEKVLSQRKKNIQENLNLNLKKYIQGKKEEEFLIILDGIMYINNL